MSTDLGDVRFRRWARARWDRQNRTIRVLHNDVVQKQAHEIQEIIERLDRISSFMTVTNGDGLVNVYGNVSPVGLRPTWDEMGMTLADTWASRSVDEKQQVGCVILSDASHMPAGQGYNGRYAGSPTETRASLEQGQSEAVHAEINALLRVRWEHGETHTLYTTHAPCPECAVAILTVRKISRVVYRTPYEMTGRRSGLDILKEGGLDTLHWDVDGA